MKKIGVLLPQSKAYPSIGKDFMKGLRLATAELNDVEFKVEGIGFGNDSEQIIDSIQKLINQEGVDLTTGLLGHRGIADVYDFVEGMDEVLIYSDMGATEPYSLEGRKGIYCNSFGLHESIKRLGNYFVDNGIVEVGISTCYYDAGYGLIKALEDAFIECENGSFAGHFITPLHPRENEAELMKEFVDSCKPKALLGFHNGIYAKEHASYLKENGVNKEVQLYTTPFSVEDSVLNEFPEIFDGTLCVSSWFPELDNEENKAFTTIYTEETGKTPSVFSLLGYENGLLIKEKLIGNDFFVSVKGPRGETKIDSNTNRTNYKHYLWELKSQEKLYLRTEKDELKAGELSAKLSTPETSDEVGGWFNAYLCH